MKLTEMQMKPPGQLIPFVLLQDGEHFHNPLRPGSHYVKRDNKTAYVVPKDTPASAPEVITFHTIFRGSEIETIPSGAKVERLPLGDATPAEPKSDECTFGDLKVGDRFICLCGGCGEQTPYVKWSAIHGRKLRDQFEYDFHPNTKVRRSPSMKAASAPETVTSAPEADPVIATFTTYIRFRRKYTESKQRLKAAELDLLRALAKADCLQPLREALS